jgi:hypothetical protein
MLPASVEVLGEECFYECRSLSSITFESGSRLSGIEARAFCGTNLIEIVIPVSVEILGEECFPPCRSVISVTFESGSRLLGNERDVLCQAGWIVRADHPQVEEVKKGLR